MGKLPPNVTDVIDTVRDTVTGSPGILLAAGLALVAVLWTLIWVLSRFVL